MEKQSDPNGNSNSLFAYKAKQSVYASLIAKSLRDPSIGEVCKSILSPIFNDDPKASVNIISSLSRLCTPGMNAQEMIRTANLIVRIDKELFASDHEQTSVFTYLIAEMGANTKSSAIAIYTLNELVSNCEIDGTNNKMLHIAKALASASSVMKDGKMLKRTVDFMFSLRGYVVDKVNEQAREARTPRLTPEEIALGIAAISIVAKLETAKSPKTYLAKYIRELKNFRSITHKSGGEAQITQNVYFVTGNELIRETLAVVALNIDVEQTEYVKNMLKQFNAQPITRTRAATDAIKLVASATKSISCLQWMCNASIEMLHHDESRYVQAMRILSLSIIATSTFPKTLMESINFAKSMPDAQFKKLVEGADQIIHNSHASRVPGYASSINRISGMDSTTFASVSDALLTIAKNAKFLSDVDIALISETFREMDDAKVGCSRLTKTSNALKQMISKDPEMTNLIPIIKLVQMFSTQSDERFDHLLRNLSEPGVKNWKSHELQHIRTKFLENKDLSDSEFIINMDLVFRAIRAKK